MYRQKSCSVVAVSDCYKWTAALSFLAPKLRGNYKQLCISHCLYNKASLFYILRKERLLSHEAS